MELIRPRLVMDRAESKALDRNIKRCPIFSALISQVWVSNCIVVVGMAKLGSGLDD